MLRPSPRRRGDVVAGGGVVAHSCADDDVESTVELAVAWSGEPVTAGVTRGRWQWCDTAERCEGGLGPDATVVGVGAHNDGRGDRPDARTRLQAGSEFLGQDAKLAVILAEHLGVLKHGCGEPSCFAPCDRLRVSWTVAATSDAPRGDGADLGVADSLPGINAEVDAAQERVECVAVRGALLVHDRPGCQEYPQRCAPSRLSWSGEVVVFTAQHRPRGCLGVEGVGLPCVGVTRTCRGTDLSDLEALLSQCRCDAGSVGRGPLDRGEDAALSPTQDPRDRRAVPVLVVGKDAVSTTAPLLQ